MTETPQERAQYVAAGFDVFLESHLDDNLLKSALGTVLAKRSKLARQLIASKREAPAPLLCLIAVLYDCLVTLEADEDPLPVIVDFAATTLSDDWVSFA